MIPLDIEICNIKVSTALFLYLTNPDCITWESISISELNNCIFDFKFTVLKIIYKQNHILGLFTLQNTIEYVFYVHMFLVLIKQ